MANFNAFSAVIETRVSQLMKAEELYVVDIPTEDLWNFYLDAFPAGTNEIFKERREYDCQCCRQFIRNMAGIVVIKNGKRQTIWEVKGLEYPFDVVAAAMSKLVQEAPIKRRAFFKEWNFGNKVTRSLGEDGKVKEWYHFHGAVNKTHFKKDAGEYLSQLDGRLTVFQRGMEELTKEAVDTVLDLIKEKQLYRGDEHKGALQAFKRLKDAYAKAEDKSLFLFENLTQPGAALKNSAIGTLIEDLSKGVELEKAVKSFESKVAPSNYKRPKALITQKMVDQAIETLQELGMEHAINRRFARFDDMNVSNVLFVDNAVSGLMAGGSPIADLLKTSVKATAPDFKKAKEVTVEEFFSKIMPKAKKVEALVENKHLANFVTMTAPVHGDSGGLFKWGNDFAWSYDGDIADSDMRAAVQAKGGRVDGAFRFTHSWNHKGRRNGSLMDLHVFMPGNSKSFDKNDETYGRGRRVGWNCRDDHQSGGRQDVDYTSVAPAAYVPVENITFPDLDRMPDGKYKCAIHNWNLRTPTDATGGFMAEIEFGGQVFEYDYPKKLAHHEWVHVATVTKKGREMTIEHHLPTTTTSQEKWGVQTQKLTKVQTILKSPNFWDDKEEGNKHWFFILEGCRTDEPVRGIYNEFLNSAFTKHRKVFEVLGDKARCQPNPNEEQLSGIGFSSTQGQKLNVLVDNRPYTVQF